MIVRFCSFAMSSGGMKGETFVEAGIVWEGAACAEDADEETAVVFLRTSLVVELVAEPGRI